MSNRTEIVFASFICLLLAACHPDPMTGSPIQPLPEPCSGVFPVPRDSGYGFIDCEGKLISEKNYEEIEPVENGAYGLLVKDGAGWGYVDANGELVLPTQYDYLFTVNGRQFVIRDTSKVYSSAYIDRTGNPISRRNYLIAGAFDQGRAFARGEDTLFLLDTTGRELVVIPGGLTMHMHRGGFVEGLAAVMENGKVGYLRRDGSWAIPPAEGFKSAYSGGLIPVSDGKLIGFMDSTGKSVFPTRFRRASDFDDGLAVAEELVSSDQGHWVILRDDGQVIEPESEFLHLFRFESGIAWYEDSVGYGLLDEWGKRITGPEFDLAGARSGDLILARRDSLFGAIDPDGKTVIPFEFQMIWRFHDGLACARKDSLYGYINQSGDWVISPQFRHIEAFSNGLVCQYPGEDHGPVLFGKEWPEGRELLYFNTSGKQVWPETD